MSRYCYSSGILFSTKPELLLNKVNDVDDYFCCSSAFGQSKLKMISEQKVDAAFRLPLLHKATCCV
jgi:hypothetical protein